jgi:IS1 family transposase
LEVDEFWTYGGEKNKVDLIYAYRITAEIVAYVWANPNLKTARKLRDKLKSLEVTYDCICSDNWDSFVCAFQDDNLVIGEKYTFV